MKNTPSYEAPKLTTFGSVERLTAEKNYFCKSTSGPEDGLFTQGPYGSDCS